MLTKQTLRFFSHLNNFPRLHYTFEKAKSKVGKGIFQRNRALIEMRKCGLDMIGEGGIYFADDDNSYEASFLHQLRWVKQVGVFNVGLIAGITDGEGPILKNSSVVGWRTPWFAKRKFPVDMAGFVVNARFLMGRKTFEKKEVLFGGMEEGQLENDFLKKLNVELQNLEVFESPREVNAWHTKTEQINTRYKMQYYYLVKKIEDNGAELIHGELLYPKKMKPRSIPS